MDFWTFNKVIAPIISKGVIIIVQDEPHWPHSCWLLSSASLYPAAIEDPAVKIGTNVNQEDNPYLSVIQTESPAKNGSSVNTLLESIYFSPKK